MDEDRNSLNGLSGYKTSCLKELSIRDGMASKKVGAVPHLVQPGYNGFVFNSNDPAGLVSLMCRVRALSDVRLDAMLRASHSLSKQFPPKQWSNTLLDAFNTRPPRVD